MAVLRTQPRLAAFASSRALAKQAGVNVGTVTRAAQALGFSGWTALQHEFRTRYVAGLSAVEVANEHALNGSTAEASFARDRDAVDYLGRSVSAETITAIARRIAHSRHTMVVAQGSFAGPGIALAHNSTIAGYDVQHVADPTVLANRLAHLGPGDLVIAINCWQIYRSTIQAFDAAADAGINTVLITDSSSPLLGSSATLQVAVPSEGAGFFPSLVGALSVCQAIVVELAALDPAKTRRALAEAEDQWTHFHLLRESSR